MNISLHFCLTFKVFSMYVCDTPKYGNIITGIRRSPSPNGKQPTFTYVLFTRLMYMCSLVRKLQRPINSLNIT